MTFEEWSRLVSRYTMPVNFLWALLKITLGLFLASGHLMVGGLYSCVLGFAKMAYLLGCARPARERPRFGIGIGALIALSGLLYAVYMGGMLALPRAFQYGPVVSLLVILLCALDLFFAVRGVLRTRRAGDGLFLALRCVNLASSLPAIVLIRIALTSWGARDTSLTNAGLGILMGAGAVGVGAYVALRFRTARA